MIHVWCCRAFLLDAFCLYDFVILSQHGLRKAGVIAFALTVSNDERCVVCSRFSYQLSRKFAHNFLDFVSPWQSSLPPRCSPWCCWPLRGSPQRPAAPRTMFEEVTSWDTKCAQFGAKKQSWWLTNTCQCPKDLPFPRNCAGRAHFRWEEDQ